MKMNKNTLVLNVDGDTRSVSVTDSDLQAISEFVKEQIEDNGTCSVTDKITELLEITDYPIEREYVVTVVVRVTASDDMDAEDKVHTSMDGDLDYEIEGVDEV